MLNSPVSVRSGQVNSPILVAESEGSIAAVKQYTNSCMFSSLC